MKLRSVLALILSLSMTVTMFPATAYGASTNKLRPSVTVSEDSSIPKTSMEYEVQADNPWQATQTVAYEFSKAEFNMMPVDVINGALVDESGNKLFTATFYDKNNTDGGAVAVKITNFESAGKDNVTFSFTTYSDAACTPEFEAPAQNNDIITISIADGVLKTTGKAGSYVTLEVTPLGGDGVSEGKYNLASIIEGGTTTTLKGTVKTYPEKVPFEAAEVMVKEKTMNSLDVDSVHVLKLSLSKHVEFASLDGSFGLTGIHGLLIETTKLETLVPADTSYSDMQPGQYYTENGGRVLYAAVKIGGTSTGSNSGYFTPYVKIDKEAKTGPVTLEIDDVYASSGSGFSSVSGIKIATYGSDGVAVTSANPPTIMAGQVKDLEDEFLWTRIVLTENLPDSLREDRTIDVELPEEAQIVTAYMDEDAGIRVSFDKSKGASYGPKAKLIDVQGLNKNSEVYVSNAGTKTYMTSTYDHGYTLADDTSGFSVTVPVDEMYAAKKWEANTSNTLIIFMPITVKAGFTGEIKAEVSGRDFETTTVTIAKVVSPLTIKTETTNVVNGMQHQPLADITIEETVPGFIGKTTGANKLTINVDNGGLVNLFALDDAKVQVTAGNLDIRNKLEYDKDGDITITVVEPSTEKSTIKISGIILNTSRMVPQGSYDVGAVVDSAYAGCATQGIVEKTDTLSLPTADAVIENGQFDDGAFGVDADLHYCTSPYMVLTTAADTNMGGTVAGFYLEAGKNSTFTVNGTSSTMDAAAYIDENNRTMVPIRYVAYALGLSEADISYDVNAATATISGLKNVIKVTTGSSVLRCSNSANVQMDTAAVNYNNRLYVPARFIAQAMGAQVSWNQDTLTVTITQ